MLRKKRQLTQQELGNLVNLDRTYISRVERGVCNASFDNIVLLANGLDVSPSFLLLGIANPRIIEALKREADYAKSER